MALGFAAAALVFPGYCAFENYLSHLAGKEQFGRQAAWRIVSLVVAGLLTWAVLFSVPRIEILILVSAGGVAVVQLIAYRRGMRKLRSTSSQKEAIGYGKRLSLLGVIGVIEARIDALLVGSLLSFASLAQYRIAETVVDMTAKRVWIIVSQPFFPRWAQAEESTAYRRLRGDMTGVIFVLTIGFIVLFFLIPVVFPVLFTDRYEPSIRLAQILVLASLVSLPGAAADLFLIARQIERPQWVLRITSTGVHLALLPFFIAGWGVTGIVLAVLCSRIAYTAAGLDLVRRAARRENARWR
jgi:O-antigen/teichoic acid export membrane protein